MVDRLQGLLLGLLAGDGPAEQSHRRASCCGSLRWRSAPLRRGVRGLFTMASTMTDPSTFCRRVNDAPPVLQMFCEIEFGQLLGTNPGAGGIAERDHRGRVMPGAPNSHDDSGLPAVIDVMMRSRGRLRAWRRLAALRLGRLMG